MKKIVYCIPAMLMGAAVFCSQGYCQQPSVRAEQDQSAESTPVPIEMAAMLTPQNTRIEFVGTHLGDKPDPRLGGFQSFSGMIVFSNQLSGPIRMEFAIDTTSIWTEIGDKLTDHLKSEDFLNVAKYPGAKFVSTKISEGAKAGLVNVAGNFTLMGVTNEITIPFEMHKSASELTARGQLTLDRTAFGMEKSTDSVNKEVSITISVGQSTPARKTSAPADQRGGFDMAERFKTMDVDGDGKLTGDEIPQRMQDLIGDIDTNSDGAVTMEEMKSGIEKIRASRR